MPDPQVKPVQQVKQVKQLQQVQQVKQVQDDSRGIVHPAAAGTVFTLERTAPGAVAARFVDWYWLSSWHLPPGVRHEQQVLSHPVVNVVFEADGANVFGLDTGRSSVTLEGRGRALGVKFRPGGFAPFFDGPMSLLTDRQVPLADVPALAGLEKLLVPLVVDLDVPNEELAAVADAALTEQVPAGRQDCETTMEWADLGVTDRALTRAEDLASAAGVGIRTLQRAFTEHVGIGPKWFLRRYRIYEVGERIAHDEHVDWAALATDLGYADQAHLTRDFTAAFGLPPAQYAAAAREHTTGSGS